MYIPKKFAETDRDILFGVIRRYDFGLLVCETPDGPMATHIPFRLEDDCLLTHMARANPHWKSFADDKQVLVIFQGPHCYVSPRWYESAPEVPTWNYVAVHAYGVPHIIEDLDEVTAGQVALVDDYEQGVWRLQDQGEDYVNNMARAIVSIRIPIERIEGKFKLNQNKSAEKRQKVIAQLKTSDDPLARDVAKLMIEREE
tara:strand:+ start:95 stop:694 length:600 start_codon:yes stop_codon:yes gene_type:complete